MFLSTLQDRNPKLLELAFRLHQNGIIQPDTYLLDLDAIETNACLMLEAANRQGLDLFFMTKQLGRNPEVCRRLVDLGYKGAVVVDFREAQVMMENHIPIAHAGHLVQIPDKMLPALLSYGVGLMTVYSLEKAEEINRVCAQLGKVQDIALKFYRPGDYTYSSQESGFPLESLPQVVERLSQMPHLRVTAITAFPCFLYDSAEGKVVPSPNLETVKLAAEQARQLLGRKLQCNLPSCTQTSLIDTIVAHGGNSAEPGNAFTGTTPNNWNGAADELPALAYVTEISHNYEGRALCFGGGHYRRSGVKAALVGSSPADARRLEVHPPHSENIDYHFELSQPAAVGETVVMCFRTQIFVTRSQVVTISGLQKGNPVIEGVYSSQGYRLSGGMKI